MYISNSIIEGLKILGFDKETVKTTSKEKDLEEIFLTNLFLNYIIVVIAFVFHFISGGFTVNGRYLNEPVFFGLLMIYPFIYNLIVYVIYGTFGLIAEMINKKKHVHPLLATGYHTALVYTIIMYTIAIFATISLNFAISLFIGFIAYFIFTMFFAIATIYNFTFNKTLMVVLIPFIILGGLFILTSVIFPEIAKSLVEVLFI